MLFLFFQLKASAEECASALKDFERRTKHRLRDGVVHRFNTDNDLGFDGPETKAVAGASQVTLVRPWSGIFDLDGSQESFWEALLSFVWVSANWGGQGEGG